MRHIALFVWLCAFLTGCGRDAESEIREFNTRAVVLPDGTKISAEVMTKEVDMRRGMMFRETFPEGTGMLFIHGSPGQYPYWMYQVKLPLDIIWMDARGRIVEIAENAQPCTTPASQCRNYGGNQTAQVVLELPGGYSRRHGVVVGDVIRF
jgi:uncharacterized membrane protein (UPF0127 family)